MYEVEQERDRTEAARKFYNFLEQRRQLFVNSRPDLSDLIAEIQREYLRGLYRHCAPACGGCASWYYTGVSDAHDEECLYES